MAPVSGAMLRDLLLCERRMELDLRGDPAGRDEVSSFVQMLWEGGVRHEEEVVSGLEGAVADLRGLQPEDRGRETLRALQRGVRWIVGGRLELGDRVGVPDLLLVEGDAVHAGDVKSGDPHAPDGRAPRPEYAVQVGHYAALLADMGLGEGSRAFVIGRDGGLVWYDLTATARGGSVAEQVATLVGKARAIRDGRLGTRAALCAACALCHWRTLCRAELEAADDLTLVAGLGRALRSVVEPVAPTVTALAALDVAALSADGHALPGLGAGRLARFRDRARLLRTPGAKPFARRALDLRRHAREFHLDIESDPLDGGLVYLHGVVEVADGRETYHAFFADGHGEEGDAFAAAWRFLLSDPAARIFHYSRFERTAYRALAARHPHVCTRAEVDELFSPARATDLLCDVVQPATEWPTSSVGIKALAKWLGFRWRDADASGAASISWFADWRRTRDPAVRTRIEAYNHDDCSATVVLLDALIRLPVMDGAAWPPPGHGATGP
ncbi:TM0106 family RecB-like putative nuclease [Sphingomonas sp. ABOLG]|jgi:predicted RecB family nuclease|uniref:TM0106 family RecB-like putative nuclease n=1 Tax=Sphingomonas sp. ABOLG TaxID=1985880 RepID=UPI000F7F6767|nr:TM0106 family RecB-like putative nuclease [Sphingomonas sp. ABOLG]RSV17326.1 TM0106 family RecB-like putative nuclease [Sphingomonas sp. ABOLG]